MGGARVTFSPEQEKLLAEYVRMMDAMFYGLTRKQLMELAFQFAEKNEIPHRFNSQKKLAGKHWLSDFCKRQGLSIRNPEQCSIARAMGFNEITCQNFYSNLKKCYEKHPYEPHRIFNMDETAVKTVPDKLSKVVSIRGKKLVNKIVSAERGITTTAVCCVSAAGIYVPPAFIFSRKRKDPRLGIGAPSGSIVMVSDSGFINGELFIEWLQHFQKFVKASKEDPVLLILDNHASHCSLETVLFCRDNNITLLTLPPHTSHHLQPLDKSFFSPLKNSYTQACEELLLSRPGVPISQYDIAALFKTAYNRVATVPTAESGFSSTGIWPFNSSIYTSVDFLPSAVTHREDPNEADNLDTISEPQSSSNETLNKSLPEEMHMELESIEKPPSISGPSKKTPTKKHDKLISPEEINPYPKSNHVPIRKRKGKSSAILTSTPNKDQLLEGRQKKKGADKKKIKKAVTGKGRVTKTARSLFPKKKKGKENNDQEDKDCRCAGCDELFGAEEEAVWIQCRDCKQWWHQDCTAFEGEIDFICDLC